MVVEAQGEEAQVAVGKKQQKHSPIVKAIAEAERSTTGEIRVHLTRRLLDKHPFGRAMKLFSQFGMTRTTHRNAVLLYVNMRLKKFAIIGDEGIHKKVGQKYWEDLAISLREDLQSTHSENAISIAVRTIGFTLAKYFPVNLEGAQSPENELPDLVSED